MSSGNSSTGTHTNGNFATLGSSPPSTVGGKGRAIPPKVTHEDASVELKTMNPERGAARGSIPLGEDIMQIARIGEVPAMQRLFDEKKFSANHKDEEGITPLHVRYNILHLATIDGNAFLLVLLLHQEIPVDVVDQQGHTGLMWAAYKGYPALVDLFLRWGAHANAVDEGGLTPLHWALVKGSLPCVLKLIEYGADKFAKTRDGKTPAVVAGEMNTTRVWYRALDEYGYDLDGNAKVSSSGLASWVRNKSLMSKFFFLWPFAIVFAAVWILSNMVVYAAIPMMLVTVFGLQWVAQKAASQGPSEYRILQKTVSLTCLKGYCAVVDLQFSLIYPAFLQAPYSGWASDTSSTYCRCNIINETLCDFVLRDTFTLVLDLWVCIQLVWITMLVAVQMIQISRNQTTYENMRGHSVDRSYPSSRAFASAVAAGTTSLNAAGLTSSGQGPNPALAQGAPRHRKHGCLQQWSSLLGIDTFFATARDGLRDGPRAVRPKNPFSRGVVTNCRDFWCDPAPYFGKREPGAAMLGGEVINYNRMYETPSRMHSGGGYQSLSVEDPEQGV
ncbi:unnamed protein product [Aspergillus oryzae]|nr:unnamed protein product [Aspergillus oryzae]GMF87471.1 unnamed protein product [Aspergillus oryzae]